MEPLLLTMAGGVKTYWKTGKSGKWGLHGLKHKSGIFTPQLPRDLRQALVQY